MGSPEALLLHRVTSEERRASVSAKELMKSCQRGRLKVRSLFTPKGSVFLLLKDASEAVVRMKTVAESQGMTAQGWMDLTWRVVETTCRVLKSEVILR